MSIVDGNPNSVPQSSPLASTSHFSAYQKVLAYVESGQLDKAIGLAGKVEYRDPRCQNAKAVCLMRLGRVNDAVALLRSLTITNHSLVIRPDLPTEFKTNFATALLLNGEVHGCLNILCEVDEEDHPAVKRLRGSIEQWVRDLTPWQRFWWRLGSPVDKPVKLDFPAGDLA